ncbi:MAG: 1-hydroxycarotenoid 3,4-desaturase CrtD [Methylocystis sp.]
MRTPRVVVVGAGIGGLVAALLLTTRGFEVTVIERAAKPGGKMRKVEAGAVKIDAGPTVFTMRWVFEEILREAHAEWPQGLTVKPLQRLARHAWSDGASLDLFTDMDRSADAIADFAGAAEADGYRQFCARAAAVYQALKDTFIRASRPNPLTLTQRAGIRGLPGLLRISPFTTLWDALSEYFRDARLRQLFGRYATYCGSSPFAAPATLMLVAHVEREGVWTLDAGMSGLAEALATLAQQRGAAFVYEQEASRIVIERGCVAGVETRGGARFPAEAVVFNGDAAALAAGLLGPEAARAATPTPPSARSLSALNWATPAITAGFPLAYHNVFFSEDYRAEFDDIFSRRRLPRAPTIYVCAQDRGEDDLLTGSPPQPERLFFLVNAPALEGLGEIDSAELRACQETTFRRLARCGLELSFDPANCVRTGPSEFARLFPATSGALYGQASHGWRSSFTRPGSLTNLPGLYLAGGSTHPGPGVPMAALSGRLAAHRLMADLASTRRSFRGATLGGTSTH